MFGCVHAVGDSDVAGGDDVGVDFGVVEYVLYIGVFEDGVAHEFVVGDGATAAHCVVGSYLVLLDLFASEVPVVVYVLSHCSPVFVIELWRAGCGRPGDARGAGSGVHFSTCSHYLFFDRITYGLVAQGRGSLLLIQRTVRSGQHYNPSR